MKLNYEFRLLLEKYNSKLENLMQYGMVKLPSLEMWFKYISKDISLEMKPNL